MMSGKEAAEWLVEFLDNLPFWLSVALIAGWLFG